MTVSPASRLLSSASNMVARRARTLAHREQHHQVGGTEVVLPPGHQLRYFQRRHPTYDTYAEALLARLAAPVEAMLLVDIGGNVGDTALAALTAAPNITVLSVEGNPEFCDYWRRNTRPFAARCDLVEGFVGPIGDGFRYADNGSTGRFSRTSQTGATDDVEWISPRSLLERADGFPRVVWKSDMDGFDIHVLAEHWDDIASRADVIWFEYHPCTTEGDTNDVDRLLDQLGRSGLGLSIYDNLGRRLLNCKAGSDGSTLGDLTAWLRQQRAGQVTVPYLDVWAFRADDALVAAFTDH